MDIVIRHESSAPGPEFVFQGQELYSLDSERKRGGFAITSMLRKEYMMAKYGKSAQRLVKRAMHKLKEDTLKSGKSGSRVKRRQQAIAIGLSEVRRQGAKVPAE